MRHTLYLKRCIFVLGFGVVRWVFGGDIGGSVVECFGICLRGDISIVRVFSDFSALYLNNKMLS